ncbi:MAG: type II secretion system protein GspC [Myxococcales bacterium]
MSSALQLGLERYFWTVNLIFLLGASYFSARTVNLFVAERIRPPPSAAALSSGSAARGGATPPLAAEAFARLMGMQLPETAPGEEGAAGAEEGDKPADLSSEPVRTSLHAQLLATVIANHPEWSLATLRDLNANDTSIYMVGESFMGATLLDIQDLKVIILNNGHREFIDLEPGGGPGPTPLAAAAPKQAGEGIRKLDDHHYQIERSTVNNALANLNELAMQARIVPSFKNGQANGFKLFSIRPDSLYSKIGIQNGDVIQRINGYDMNSPDKALEAYTKLRNAGALDLNIERNGQTMSYHYAIQ